jgi:MYXO-CTERM domain-containing protein
MTLVRALFVFATLILPASSFALPVPGVPTAVLVVSGVTGPIEFSVLPSNGEFTASLDLFLPNVFEILGDVSFDPDPFVEYSFGVKNFLAVSQTFSFTFLTPFGGGPYSRLSSSHSSNVTDGATVGVATDGSVLVTPVGGTFIHRPQINGAPAVGLDGVTLVGQFGPGCDPSGAPGFSAFCNVGSGTFPISPVSGPPGSLSVTVSFELSPGDLYATSGRVELLDAVSPTATPEPSTLLLGLGVLAGILYRQRRR